METVASFITRFDTGMKVPDRYRYGSIGPVQVWKYRNGAILYYLVNDGIVYYEELADHDIIICKETSTA